MTHARRALPFSSLDGGNIPVMRCVSAPALSHATSGSSLSDDDATGESPATTEPCLVPPLHPSTVQGNRALLFAAETA